jgi:hypothetical protein
MTLTRKRAALAGSIALSGALAAAGVGLSQLGSASAAPASSGSGWQVSTTNANIYTYSGGVPFTVTGDTPGPVATGLAQQQKLRLLCYYEVAGTTTASQGTRWDLIDSRSLTFTTPGTANQTYVINDSQVSPNSSSPTANAQPCSSSQSGSQSGTAPGGPVTGKKKHHHKKKHHRHHKKTSVQYDGQYNGGQPNYGQPYNGQPSNGGQPYNGQPNTGPQDNPPPAS